MLKQEGTCSAYSRLIGASRPLLESLFMLRVAAFWHACVLEHDSSRKLSQVADS